MLRGTRSAAAWCATPSLLFGLACASTPSADLADRVERAEREILERGLSDDAQIEAKRAELEAAQARRESAPWVDEVEIRTTVAHRRDEQVRVLARLPLARIPELGAQRAARAAEAEAALAGLEQSTLEARVRQCLPSLELLAHRERQELYAQYADRQKRLLDWSRDLAEAGRLDEVGATRFALQTEVRLATRAPAPGPASVVPLPPLPVLPDLETGDANPTPLDSSREVLRAQLVEHHPELGVHEARERRYAALSRRARLRRLPTLGFVEAGYEPVTQQGNDHEWRGGVSVEIPLGFTARADEKRYQALARGQRSEGRALLDRRTTDGLAALAQLNAFRSRNSEWVRLLEQADSAEAVADRWWEARLTSPPQVSALLDEVYAARLAVIDARERAGLAHCALLTATGVESSAWPR